MYAIRSYYAKHFSNVSRSQFRRSSQTASTSSFQESHPDRAVAFSPAAGGTVVTGGRTGDASGTARVRGVSCRNYPQNFARPGPFCQNARRVITSYSIHYTKLYDSPRRRSSRLGSVFGRVHVPLIAQSRTSITTSMGEDIEEILDYIQ